QGGTITSGTELRLGVLRSLRRVVELLGSAFAECRSGLQRLDQYGREIAALPSYRRVCELLDYEAHRGEVDIRIRLGFDGEVRGFEALERRANRSNPFSSTALGRWFTRLGMFLRGERSSPNEILSRLADDLFSGLEPRLVYFLQLIGDLEFYL